jgi:putative Mg2+ transporter-C (MgtC) family protein
VNTFPVWKFLQKALPALSGAGAQEPAMPLVLEWPEIARRLALTVLAGLLIGLDRDEHGRPAGLRTTLLVCLAAAIAMIQVNLLLVTVGKARDSFVNLDLMRLPLGILTGVGFIGGGAILRRQGGVIGVTTAATLWFVTVIGLCFGSGEIGLGLAGTALALVVLTALKGLEKFIPRDHRAKLILIAAPAPPDEEIDHVLAAAGVRVVSRSIAYTAEPHEIRLELAVQWRSRGRQSNPPDVLPGFARRADIQRLEWKAQDLER